jgi:acetyl-CoA acetyltransferase
LRPTAWGPFGVAACADAGLTIFGWILYVLWRDGDVGHADLFAVALDAIQSGKFTEQIVPIEIRIKGGTTQFATDESPRQDATLENLAKLRPVFDKNGTVTAGNSSSINDGAAALVLMERQAAEERGLKPMAKLVDYAVAEWNTWA